MRKFVSSPKRGNLLGVGFGNTMRVYRWGMPYRSVMSFSCTFNLEPEQMDNINRFVSHIEGEDMRREIIEPEWEVFV